MLRTSKVGVIVIAEWGGEWNRMCGSPSKENALLCLWEGCLAEHLHLRISLHEPLQGIAIHNSYACASQSSNAPCQSINLPPGLYLWTTLSPDGHIFVLIVLLLVSCLQMLSLLCCHQYSLLFIIQTPMVALVFRLLRNAVYLSNDSIRRMWTSVVCRSFSRCNCK